MEVVVRNAPFMLGSFDVTRTDVVKTAFASVNSTNLYVPNLVLDMARPPFFVPSPYPGFAGSTAHLESSYRSPRQAVPASRPRSS